MAGTLAPTPDRVAAACRPPVTGDLWTIVDYRAHRPGVGRCLPPLACVSLLRHRPNVRHSWARRGQPPLLRHHFSWDASLHGSRAELQRPGWWRSGGLPHPGRQLRCSHPYRVLGELRCFSCAAGHRNVPACTWSHRALFQPVAAVPGTSVGLAVDRAQPDGTGRAAVTVERTLLAPR